ncbi:MAG: hypothetical protein N4R12_02310, partial [Lactobacillus crispatus]|nr:hypothetical protein [Lactobacillus crispatus]
EINLRNHSSLHKLFYSLACSLSDADIDNILDNKVTYLVPKPLSSFTSIQINMIDNAFTRAYRKYVGM